MKPIEGVRRAHQRQHCAAYKYNCQGAHQYLSRSGGRLPLFHVVYQQPNKYEATSDSSLIESRNQIGDILQVNHFSFGQ